MAPRVKHDFARLRGVRVVRRGFRPGDLAGQPWLVVAATDDEALHARVAALCRQRRIWVNVVDRPSLCDFIDAVGDAARARDLRGVHGRASRPWRNIWVPRCGGGSAPKWGAW
ncbi:MAG: NAD(P)-dependent oxidoreductase [Elusimicrobia bacterium]|nr:NAD(P)-dependent oxidoreductase [Elusimicrobiota bacterium]